MSKNYIAAMIAAQILSRYEDFVKASLGKSHAGDAPSPEAMDHLIEAALRTAVRIVNHAENDATLWHGA
jgi:hypothetical protein